VVSTTFNGNQADAQGGALDIDSGVAVLNGDTIGSSTGGGNRATGSGGGLDFQGDFFQNGSLSIANSLIQGNTTASTGGGVAAFPGSPGVVTVTNSLVDGNTAASDGGGLQMASGDQLTLANTTVSNNQSAGMGGGLITAAQNTTVSFSQFQQNSAATGGGGIAFTAFNNNPAGLSSSPPNPNLTVQNSALLANTAGGNGSGGAVLANALAAQSTVNLINSTLAANTAGVAGGGLATYNGDLASLLFATVAYNQAPYGGGIANVANSSGTPTVNLGNTIVSQNFNFAPPPPSYPSSQAGATDPVPPFISPALTGPDLSGAFADLTEANLNTTLNLTATTTPPASTTPAVVIGHNVIGASDGSTGITNQSVVAGQITNDQVGTTSAPILAVGSITPNGVPVPAPAVTLIGPVLPLSGQPQYLAAPVAAGSASSNPLTTAQQNGFADSFIFTIAPTDQRGSPLLNTATNANVVYLRPITDGNTQPPSNNPDVGAMEVTTYVSGLPVTTY
jgi:hypothetical protein